MLLLHPLRVLERLAAFLVDIAIIWVASTPLQTFLRWIHPNMPASVSIMTILMVGLVYHTLLPPTRLRDTLGLYMANARLIHIDGSALTWRESLLRTVLWAASAICLGLGLVPILFSSHHRGVHDIVTHSLVIRRPVAKPPVSGFIESER